VRVARPQLALLGLGSVALLLVSCSLLVGSPDCAADHDCLSGEVCASEGLCRPLVNELCGETLGEFLDRDSILLGVLLPLSGENTESGIHLRRAIELAIEEINAVGGVQGGQGRRKLAALVCDSQGDPSIGVAAAAYLAGVASVPAIIGAAFSRVTLPVARDVAIGTGTVLISPASTAVEISDLVDDDLVWRTVPPDSRQADTMAHYATWEVLQVAGVNAYGVASQSQAEVKVSLVYPEDSYGQGLKHSFEDLLESKVAGTLNAVPGLQLGSTGLQLVFESSSYADTDPETVAAIAAQVAASAPDVVMLAGYDESSSLLAALLESDHLREQTSFFLSDGMRSDFLVTAFGSEGEGKPPLLFGANPGGRLAGDEVWEGFRDRYASRWNEDPLTLHNYVENAYDAAYLLAYSLSSLPAGAVAGRDVGAALKALAGDPAGLYVRVGPQDLLVAFREVWDGARLNLRGASGPIAFEDATGDPIAASIIRWDVDWDGARWQVVECGVASTYEVGGGQIRDWCAAHCTDAIPTHGDDDDSAGDDDDSAGDDDDSAAVGDPCRPPVMGS
jgi:ABC-type branched-subunit amino acid transport system substrate-binding protein